MPPPPTRGAAPGYSAQHIRGPPASGAGRGRGQMSPPTASYGPGHPAQHTPGQPAPGAGRGRSQMPPPMTAYGVRPTQSTGDLAAGYQHGFQNPPAPRQTQQQRGTHSTGDLRALGNPAAFPALAPSASSKNLRAYGPGTGPEIREIPPHGSHSRSSSTVQPPPRPLSYNNMRGIHHFQRDLDKQKMERCSRCSEEWLDMELEGGICKRCRKLDTPGSNPAHFFSNENLLEPSCVDLPPLSEIKEQLIAAAQAVVSVRLVRGPESRFQGYVVHAVRENVWIPKKLPVASDELEQVVIVPKGFDGDDDYRQQFADVFVVRPNVLRQRLEYLIQHNPFYRNVSIDHAALQDYAPGGEDIMDRFLVCREDREFPSGPAMVPPETRMAPDVVSFRVQPSSPKVEVRLGFPVAEFTKFPLVSRAFPSLFPNGDAEFVLPRPRPISWPDYVEHLLKHSDKRFIRHPSFRHTLYNLSFQRQARSRAEFYANQHEDGVKWTLEDLQTAILDDTPTNNTLLNSVLYQAESLQGSQPF
ncbi:hypothetical protein IWZ01DRAFT_574706 [Phyllosticta capitalensis]